VRKLERRLARAVIYGGFGFPVELRNVSMVLVRGTWTPDLDMNRLTDLVLRALAQKPARLTGNEIRFIRLSWSMTLQNFADRFSVTHPAVLKWEGTRDEATAMAWATEKDIRLELLRRAGIKPAEFLDAYGTFARSRPDRPVAPTSLELGSMWTAGGVRRRAAAERPLAR
jgi:hypothetical protein